MIRSRTLVLLVSAIFITILIGIPVASMEPAGEVNITASGEGVSQWGPSVAVDGDGNFHMVHYYNDGEDYEARYKKLAPDGMIVTNREGINPAIVGDGTIRWMEIATDQNGDAHIVLSMRLTSNDFYDIYYTKISSAGSVLVQAAPSEHEKCVRCWHHRADVGSHSEHPELCGRCIENVDGSGEQRRYA